MVVLLSNGKNFVILRRDNLEVVNRFRTNESCDRDQLTSVNGTVINRNYMHNYVLYVDDFFLDKS